MLVRDLTRHGLFYLYDKKGMLFPTIAVDIFVAVAILIIPQEVSGNAAESTVLEHMKTGTHSVYVHPHTFLNFSSHLSMVWLTIRHKNFDLFGIEVNFIFVKI